MNEPPETVESIVDTIESFVCKRFFIAPARRRDLRVVALWDEGIIDSAGVLDLIAFLEQTFSIAISPEVIASPSFTTLNGIGGVVMELRSRR